LATLLATQHYQYYADPDPQHCFSASLNQNAVVRT
jgi:hypothetical protein